MDANWWFWNLLLAVSPALLIGVYCQLVVIPKMLEQNANEMQQEAANMTWAESLQQLMQYLKGEEMQILKEEETAAAEPNAKLDKVPSTDNRENAVQLQLQELRRQLDQLEEEMQQNSMDTQRDANVNSNIRHRYVEQQRKQRRTQQESGKDATTNNASKGTIHNITVSIQAWWHQYMEHMKDQRSCQR
ncbi:MAG: hypothetical protein SGARI_003936 [Bacillariaceae sp.]